MQRGFYVFRTATAYKFYLERTIAGDSKQAKPSARRTAGGQSRWSAMADYLIVAYIDALCPHNVSLNFNVCVISMILKYRTLYSKSKLFLNREKLLTNHVNMSTILFIM